MKQKEYKGTESYTVVFCIIAEDGTWEYKDKTYYGFHGKNDHRKVEKKWRNEFKSNKIKLVSITYQ